MKKLFLIGLLASLFNPSKNRGVAFKSSQKKFSVLTPDEIDQKNSINNGLKSFDFPGGRIYAINYKNAERKAKKKNFV